MADQKNILSVRDRDEFRKWLADNHSTQKECWVILKRGKPVDGNHFWYLDAVEEALCFGWIDSTLGLVNGVRMQKFTPRSSKSNWTELNKERVRRLERLGLMTDAGRAVLPDMEFSMDSEIEKDIRSNGLWEQFSSFPPLYRRVRAYNLAFARSRSEEEYTKAFANFTRMTREGLTYGQWNDYGRLL